MIPDVKIFTYGYDADIDGFLSGAGQNTINQHAQSLLSDLSDLRSSPAEVSLFPDCQRQGGTDLGVGPPLSSLLVTKHLF